MIPKVKSKKIFLKENVKNDVFVSSQKALKIWTLQRTKKGKIPLKNKMVDLS